jgi:hypothetical protein
MQTLLRINLSLLAVFALFVSNSSYGAAESAGSGWPTGPNCSLAAPPANSGEEGGHGALLQAYPRASAIGPSYSGCQAVFITKAMRPAQLGWLVEVVKGDPVAMWSPDEKLKQLNACRFNRGSLVRGDASVCKAVPIILPTQPAGCMNGTTRGDVCEYDLK